MPRIDATAGQIYDVGGPDVLTYAEIMRSYGDLVGKRPRIIPVPVLTPRLSSYWLRFVTSVPNIIVFQYKPESLTHTMTPWQLPSTGIPRCRPASA